MNNRVTIQKTYTTTITKYFLSQIETADFEDSKATVNTINGFIFDQTRGLIENMLEEDDIDHSASLIMVNVIYFKVFYIVFLWSLWFLSFVRLFVIKNCDRVFTHLAVSWSV